MRPLIIIATAILLLGVGCAGQDQRVATKDVTAKNLAVVVRTEDVRDILCDDEEGGWSTPLYPPLDDQPLPPDCQRGIRVISLQDFINASGFVYRAQRTSSTPARLEKVK